LPHHTTFRVVINNSFKKRLDKLSLINYIYQHNLISKNDLIILKIVWEVRKMVKRAEKGSCSEPACEKMSCCKIEALISVDERGQMVLPKEMRDKAGIRTADKLALVSWERDGKICCFTLIKADEFGDMVKGLLGPMMKEVMASDAAN
jgi:bifunctional DNA-binding transcriptional regulator/antitoxin component of YhaV-PrlF toxin-antitoxin module